MKDEATFHRVFFRSLWLFSAEDKPLSVSTAAMKHRDVLLLTPVAADQALSCL